MSYANGLVSGYKDGIIPATGPNSPAPPKDSFAAEVASHFDLKTPPTELNLPQPTEQASAAGSAPSTSPLELSRPISNTSSPSNISKTAPVLRLPPSEKSSKMSSNRDDERIFQARMQLFEKGLHAKVNVPFSPPVSKGRIKQTQADRLNVADTNRTDILNASQTDQDTLDNKNSDPYEHFSKNNEKWEITNAVDTPKTPYVVRAGSYIPATMISGITSETPGPISAQISQNVYDTATGKHLLLPQGSKLIGTYGNEISYGQNRILVAWQRIVFPDGRALDIGAMPGADVSGYSGFQEKVNNHYMRTFSSAILISALGAGLTYAAGGTAGLTPINPNNTQQTIASAFSQQLGQTAMDILSKNLNLAPTLEISPGYQFNVILNKDLVLKKPYKLFNY